MSVKYVYVPESPVPNIIPLAIGLLALLVIGGLAAYFFWPDADQSSASLSANNTTGSPQGSAGIAANNAAGNPQSLAGFLAEDTATVYVVDNSGSIGQYVGFLANQVEKIGIEAQENSEAALILFGSQYDEVLPLGSIEKDEWGNASTRVGNFMGGTYLFTAAVQGLTLLEEVDPGIHRKLVLLTDGIAHDEHLMPGLIDSANRLGVSIDTIALGNNEYSSTLQDLSTQTGGTFSDWQEANQATN